MNLGIILLVGVYITIWVMAARMLDWDEAIWWPIILVKRMILSLIKVLFTGWKL